MNLKGFFLSPFIWSTYNYLLCNAHTDTATPNAHTACHWADSFQAPVTQQPVHLKRHAQGASGRVGAHPRVFSTPALLAFLLAPSPLKYLIAELEQNGHKEWQMIFPPFKDKLRRLSFRGDVQWEKCLASSGDVCEHHAPLNSAAPSLFWAANTHKGLVSKEWPYLWHLCFCFNCRAA